MDNVILASYIGKFKPHKMNHIRGVAQLMYELADGDECYKQDMFLLGLVHDLGYITGKAKNHRCSGGEMLKRNGYKYWQEVYYHGECDAPYSSKELDLLNSADLQINSLGERVGYQARLEDIRSRYGNESIQYHNALNLVKKLSGANGAGNVI